MSHTPTYAEIADALTERKGWQIRPHQTAAIPQLLPDWRIAYGVRLAAGSEGTNVAHINATRRFRLMGANLLGERDRADFGTHVPARPNPTLKLAVLGIFGAQFNKTEVQTRCTRSSKTSDYLLRIDGTNTDCGGETPLTHEFIGKLMKTELLLVTFGVEPTPIALTEPIAELMRTDVF